MTHIRSLSLGEDTSAWDDVLANGRGAGSPSSGPSARSPVVSAFAVLQGALENSASSTTILCGESGVMDTVARVGRFRYGLGIVVSAVALTSRDRKARGGQRQQLKWLATAWGFLAVSLFASFVTQAARRETFARAVQLFTGQPLALEGGT